MAVRSGLGMSSLNQSHQTTSLVDRPRLLVPRYFAITNHRRFDFHYRHNSPISPYCTPLRGRPTKRDMISTLKLDIAAAATAPVRLYDQVTPSQVASRQQRRRRRVRSAAVNLPPSRPEIERRDPASKSYNRC